MLRALYSAATGMEAQQLNVEVVANNIANINTSGFKRRRAQFQDLLYQNVRAAGSSSSANTEYPVGLQVGLGSRPVATEAIFSQGDFAQTGNPLDMVIQGNGFFQVQMTTGEIAYTRSGAFHLDREGNVVTADGDPLEPQITIPQDALAVTVGSDGTVSVIQAGQQQAQQVGSIELAMFINPAGLQSIGKNLFLASTASGDPVTGQPGEQGAGTLVQGYLEQSNVDIVEEMVNMIISQRAYESSSKVLRVSDEMYTTVNNTIR